MLVRRLNIKSTGYIHSNADDCFQPDARSNCGDVFLLRIKDIVLKMNEQQKIQSLENEFSSGNKFGVGAHTSECSDPVKCEFKLTYTISETNKTIVNPPAPVPPPNPVPTSTCDLKSQTLLKVSRGEKVKELQRDSTQLGFGDPLGKFSPNGDGIDGVFGESTKKAVIKFQQDNQLKKIDGIVGSESCDSINSLIPVTSFETKPKISYIALGDQTDSQQSDPNLQEPSSSLPTDSNSGPDADPTADPGVELSDVEREEASDQANIGSVLQSINNTQISQVAGNTTSLPAQPNNTFTETPVKGIPEGLTCNDGSAPDANGLCADGSQPQMQPTNNNVTTGTEEQPVCNDGSAPDANGLCADGSQPQMQPTNNNVTTGTEEQPVCNDGSAPDANGLCADGSQPQMQPTNNNVTTGTEEQPVCNDGSAPDANGLCADGSQPDEPTNNNVTTGTEEQPVCNDGSAPDANGLCADGSQPQPANNARLPQLLPIPEQPVCS